MSHAIQIREAHFPGRAPIDAYGNGGFRFADMSHRGSIICIPSGIYGIDMTGPVPTQEDISRVLEESDQIEVLLIGTELNYCDYLKSYGYCYGKSVFHQIQ